MTIDVKTIIKSCCTLVLLTGFHSATLAETAAMERHHNINYIEIPTKDIQASKAFFTAVFGWDFIDYGPEYSSFVARGIDGGFFSAKQTVSTATGSPLIVLYSGDLEETQSAVKEAGGEVIQAIFDFPGGRRFHFTDPAGNEYAVWSE